MKLLLAIQASWYLGTPFRIQLPNGLRKAAKVGPVLGQLAAYAGDLGEASGAWLCPDTLGETGVSFFFSPAFYVTLTSKWMNQSCKKKKK